MNPQARAPSHSIALTPRPRIRAALTSSQGVRLSSSPAHTCARPLPLHANTHHAHHTTPTHTTPASVASDRSRAPPRLSPQSSLHRTPPPSTLRNQPVRHRPQDRAPGRMCCTHLLHLTMSGARPYARALCAAIPSASHSAIVCLVLYHHRHVVCLCVWAWGLAALRPLPTVRALPPRS